MSDAAVHPAPAIVASQPAAAVYPNMAGVGAGVNLTGGVRHTPEVDNTAMQPTAGGAPSTGSAATGLPAETPTTTATTMTRGIPGRGAATAEAHADGKAEGEAEGIAEAQDCADGGAHAVPGANAAVDRNGLPADYVPASPGLGPVPNRPRRLGTPVGASTRIGTHGVPGAGLGTRELDANNVGHNAPGIQAAQAYAAGSPMMGGAGGMPAGTGMGMVYNSGAPLVAGGGQPVGVVPGYGIGGYGYGYGGANYANAYRYPTQANVPTYASISIPATPGTGATYTVIYPRGSGGSRSCSRSHSRSGRHRHHHGHHRRSSCSSSSSSPSPTYSRGRSRSLGMPPSSAPAAYTIQTPGPAPAPMPPIMPPIMPMQPYAPASGVYPIAYIAPPGTSAVRPAPTQPYNYSAPGRFTNAYPSSATGAGTTHASSTGFFGRLFGRRPRRSSTAPVTGVPAPVVGVGPTVGATGTGTAPVGYVAQPQIYYPGQQVPPVVGLPHRRRSRSRSRSRRRRDSY